MPSPRYRPQAVHRAEDWSVRHQSRLGTPRWASASPLRVRYFGVLADAAVRLKLNEVWHFAQA